MKLFYYFFEKIKTLSRLSNVVWHFGCISYNKLLLWISYSDSLYSTLYGNMVQKLLTFFKKFQKCPRSVNNFRTEYLGGYFGDFWSPYVAEASHRCIITKTELVRLCGPQHIQNKQNIHKYRQLNKIWEIKIMTYKSG